MTLCIHESPLAYAVLFAWDICSGIVYSQGQSALVPVEQQLQKNAHDWIEWRCSVLGKHGTAHCRPVRF